MGTNRAIIRGRCVRAYRAVCRRGQTKPIYYNKFIHDEIHSRYKGRYDPNLR